jgi:hypothetical protein
MRTPSLAAVALLLWFAPRAPAVVPIAADPLIQPAHYFDLGGKALRFRPVRSGYEVSVAKAGKPGPPGERLGYADYQFLRSWGYRKTLPFPFPFGGQVWHEVFVNGAGNLTFGKAEAELFPERDTWPDGTMQTVGGAINARAAAGREKIICALWADYDPHEDKTNIYVRQSAKEFVVTWKAQRVYWFGEGYQPLGPNTFEARLTPDGSIALTYYEVSEKDGIVGVFPGGFFGRPLASLDDGATEASVAGSTLRFSFAAGKPLAAGENRRYSIALNQGLTTCEIGVETKDSVPYFAQQCRGYPGYRMAEGRVELYVTTFDLWNVLRPGVRWLADVNGKSMELEPFPYSGDAAAQPYRLSALHGYREGNICEVFHYPHVSKQPFPLIRYIYSRVPAEDDFAAILTDFRIDDLYNAQGTRTGFAPAVQGIGEEPKQSYDASEAAGSTKLQAVTGPVYLGPRFAEFLEDGGRHYKNYAHAVGWMAHEFGHRWGMSLRFRNPVTDKVEDLADTSGHWSDFLNTPSMISVWKMFCDKPYVEKSQMEGFVYTDKGGGLFVREVPSWNIASGFSPLDLYVMGLIGPQDVPDTFLIAHAGSKYGLELHGERVPVRIRDVIAAEGPRLPGTGDSQKRFRVGLYLLHEGSRPPDPEKLKQAEGIEQSLLEYYRVATAGRLEMTATQRR